MTNKAPDMSLKEDQDKCRSLVCDSSGIIVAEIVYRCMVCFCVSESMKDARTHYKLKHIDDDKLEKNRLTTTELYNNHCDNDVDESIPPVSENVETKFENDEQYSPDEMDNFEHFSPLVTMSEGFEPINGNVSGGKSGYVNCAVCGVTRFYSCVQRRYGQFTCVTCYRYFRTFLLKPKRFSCPNLGACQLNVRTRCRACWINACINVFSVDIRRQEVINAFRPHRKPIAKSPTPIPKTEPEAEVFENESFPVLKEDSFENDEMPDNVDNDLSTLAFAYASGDEMPSMLDANDYNMDEKLMKTSHNQVKLTPGKKIWSCGKCATCMAEDCGKCIYCLDRPKFGGPFIKKQRCIKRRCLMKIKNKQNGFSFNG